MACAKKAAFDEAVSRYILPATTYEAVSIVVKMPNQTTSWENEMKCLAYILWSCNWWHLTMNADTVHPMATNHNY